MSVKRKLSKLIKIFGSIYFLLNCIICVVMCIFAIHAMIKTEMSPGFVVFLLPLIGTFSGYWMRIGKYGWWRVLIIAISLLLTVAITFTAIFISPKMEMLKQKKFESAKKVITLDPEVKKMVTIQRNIYKSIKKSLTGFSRKNPKNKLERTICLFRP